ncbi:MAG: YhgE/Pip domain-containing protein [Lachnospiraceae bacterium]|nr:YhgE/Pip domain-containing protein [Lachnospiraceae bacterium]
MIKKIFLTDLKNLMKSFFALVIAIGVCFLPALYAWCNIYSNWDPYGSTGNLQVAAVSLDEGFMPDEGEFENKGNEIIEELHDNDKIDWQFVNSEDEAIDGVTSGKYYAALVIPKDFTYNMYNVFTEDVNRPTLSFYQNQKKNPIASKITDTVVENLQASITEKYIEVMAQEVFKGANRVYDDIEEEGGVDGLLEKLDDLAAEIKSYEDMIDVAIRGNASLTNALTLAEKDVSEMKDMTDESARSMNEAGANMDKTKVTLDDYEKQVNTSVETVQNLLSKSSKTLKDAKLKNDAKEMKEAAESTGRALTALKANLEALGVAATGNDVLTAQIGALTKNIDNANLILASLVDENSVDGKIENERENATKQLDEAIADIDDTKESFNNDIVPGMDNTMDSLSVVISNSERTMNQLSKALTGMGDVFGALELTASGADKSLAASRDALTTLRERIEKATDKVRKVSDDERMDILLETLSGDPTRYGEFFAEPVKIETEVLYPVNNYGSAVGPFYTTLALWVGALILTAVMKVRPDKKKFPEAKSHELFFGRYIIFFILGQFQTAVTVLGDFVLLHMQCEEPFWFYIASVLTSTVFTMLIFALVYAFGDVGKAIAVVLVVLQIAGSSGTYPIELLPEFFRKVYIFFPFPYAINAMREALAGMYKNDYLIYMLELSIFIVVSVVIGVFITKPFAKLNHYMEERMEDTEML